MRDSEKAGQVTRFPRLGRRVVLVGVAPLCGIVFGVTGCRQNADPPPPPPESYAAATFQYTSDGEVRAVPGARVRPEFFGSAWTVPALGRVFVESDYAPDAEAVAIISDSFWREELGTAPAIIGGAIVIDGKPATVVGVLPRGSEFPSEARIWLPEPSAPPYVGVASMDLASTTGPVRVWTMRVPAGFFNNLATQPLLGRVRPDDWVGTSDVAVISHRLWQARFGAAPDVVGRTVALSDAPVTIIGVMADGWDRTRGVDVWLPDRPRAAR